MSWHIFLSQHIVSNEILSFCKCSNVTEHATPDNKLCVCVHKFRQKMDMQAKSRIHKQQQQQKHTRTNTSFVKCHRFS